MGLLEGGGVIDAIAGHRHYFAIGLQGFDNPQLLLGRYPGVEAAAGYHLLQFRVVVALQLAAEHDFGILAREANAGPNRPGRERMVAGDHHRTDAGAAAGGHRGTHLGPGRIELGHQAQEHQLVGLLLGAAVVGGAGKGQHPQAAGRQLAGLIQPPVPLLLAQVADAWGRQPTVTA